VLAESTAGHLRPSTERCKHGECTGNNRPRLPLSAPLTAVSGTCCVVDGDHAAVDTESLWSLPHALLQAYFNIIPTHDKNKSTTAAAGPGEELGSINKNVWAIFHWIAELACGNPFGRWLSRRRGERRGEARREAERRNKRLGE
jgi:hypothetical protein